ncbi:hypothetical protein LCGC14_2056300 [marine sediment metagenome]|uniref:ASCH domain-containing protein n=1 Tax=marine sediment metagenome TaxID=412755 RepID=A0A0F9H112_9ZZZZ
MTDHPIFFKSDMVRAILDGRKTQTRRIIKNMPKEWHRGQTGFENNPHGDEEVIIHGDCGSETIYCRYSVGDLLWVRENVRTICYSGGPDFGYGEFCIEYLADEQLVKCPDELEKWWRHNWHVRPSTTIPSIHMPKDACRLWLKVKSVRVERVQEISEADVRAEGVSGVCNFGENIDHVAGGCDCARDRFVGLWDSIYAKRGYGWEVNPGVWVVEFERYDNTT